MPEVPASVSQEGPIAASLRRGLGLTPAEPGDAPLPPQEPRRRAGPPAMAPPEPAAPAAPQRTLRAETTEITPPGLEAQEGESPPEDGQTPETPPEPPLEEGGTIEVEFNGKNYEVPVELKDALLAQADYTRNMQALGKVRETTAAREQASQQALAALNVAGPLVAEWHNTMGFLQQAQQVDLNMLRQVNPQEANNLEVRMLAANQKARDLQQQLAAVPQMLREMDEKAVRDEAQRNMPEAVRIVPDLAKPERAKELAEAGLRRGVPYEALQRMTDPWAVRCLRDLAEYDKLVANRDQIRQKVAAAPPVAKPGASSRVQTASAATKDARQALRAAAANSSDDNIVAAMRAQRRLNQG